LTKDEIILDGLTTGKDVPLEIRHGGIARRGVFATASIAKSSWLGEYKATRIFPLSQKAEVEEEFDKNGEKCYMVDSAYPVLSSGKMYWEATRQYHQFGRYMNHAKHPNAEITKPYWAREKWRIGFVACKDSAVVDEVVWDRGRSGVGASLSKE